MSQRASDTGWDLNVLVGAATVHDGRFLLLQRSDRESFLPNIWGIPAGQMRQDEDPKEACARELYEETGLRGHIIGLMGYSRFTSQRGHAKLNNIQMNFLVDVEDCRVKIDQASHSAFKWISLDDSDFDVLDDFTRRIMDSARVYLKEQLI